MKGFLYSIVGLLFFLSFVREKEVAHTAEFLYSEVYEENYAEIEIDETGLITPLGEGLISHSQGKPRRHKVSISRESFLPRFLEQKKIWFTHQLGLLDVKLKSITRTLIYKSAYQRLLLFQFVLL